MSTETSRRGGSLAVVLIVGGLLAGFALLVVLGGVFWLLMAQNAAMEDAADMAAAYESSVDPADVIIERPPDLVPAQAVPSVAPPLGLSCRFATASVSRKADGSYAILITAKAKSGNSETPPLSHFEVSSAWTMNPERPCTISLPPDRLTRHPVDFLIRTPPLAPHEKSLHLRFDVSAMSGGESYFRTESMQVDIPPVR